MIWFLTREPTYDGQHGAGRVVVQGGVHEAGVGALITIRHVHDGQSVGIHHKPESTAALEAWPAFSIARPPGSPATSRRRAARRCP